jgi:hypothetical protein
VAVYLGADGRFYDVNYDLVKVADIDDDLEKIESNAKYNKIKINFFFFSYF